MNTISIRQDEEAESPLEYGDYHITYKEGSRYILGDTPIATWAEVQRIADDPANIVLPVYTYIHSGITMQTGSFYGQLPQGHAEFDSGQSGIIFIRRADVRANRMIKRITSKVLADEIATMRDIVRQYGQWLNGECWYITVNDENGKSVDGLSVIGDYTETITELRNDYGVDEDDVLTENE